MVNFPHETMFGPAQLCLLRARAVCPRTALVQGLGVLRIRVFEVAGYEVVPMRWTDFGRAHANMRLRTVQPVVSSIC